MEGVLRGHKEDKESRRGEERRGEERGRKEKKVALKMIPLGNLFIPT